MQTHSFQFVLLSQRRATRLLVAAACCVLFVGSIRANDYDFVVQGVSGAAWLDTGLDIEQNSIIQISATGEVDVSAGWGTHGPLGTTGSGCAEVTGYPLGRRNPCYGLIARLTNVGPRRGTADWAYVEPDGQFAAPHGGHLWLTVNDDNPADNHGFFKVHVRVITFPGPLFLCRPCPGDFDLKRLRGEYPDPRVSPVLLVLDGEITSVKQARGVNIVSVTQGSIVAKYGEVPNLKLVFEANKVRTTASFSKRTVIQGVLFNGNKMSLITDTSRLERSSNLPGKIAGEIAP